MRLTKANFTDSFIIARRLLFLGLTELKCIQYRCCCIFQCFALTTNVKMKSFGKTINVGKNLENILDRFNTMRALCVSERLNTSLFSIYFGA